MPSLGLTRGFPAGYFIFPTAFYSTDLAAADKHLERLLSMISMLGCSITAFQSLRTGCDARRIREL
jgi:hypothetical protein